MRGVGLLIADQPVDPQIGDLDLQLIRTGIERIGHVHSKGRLPYDSQILSFDPHLRHIHDLANIQPQPRPG